MKVWIDALTPKQVNLFSVFVRRLEARGHSVFLTSRAYREAEELLKLRRTKATLVGRHGGAGLESKLSESAKRVDALTGYVSTVRPNLALSFASPEAARVAYGLGIPHYALNDSPHTEAVCRLSLPLTRRLFTPWVIPVRAWAGYGIASGNIARYRALDPVVWLREYGSGTDVRESLGLDAHKPIVVLRTHEEEAAYLLGKTSAVVDAARMLGEVSGLQVVVLPRYDGQAARLREELGGVAVVPNCLIDAIGLLSRSAVFVGAGGTMNAEAALMGMPTVSCYPGLPTWVDRYLFRAGLAVRILSPGKIARFAKKAVKTAGCVEKNRVRVKRLIGGMDDPVAFVLGRLRL